MDRNTNRSGYGVVLVTTASRLEAEAIATSVVQAQLAACVSLLPIHSIYTWQGELHQEQEWQLLIKTDLAQFQTLETKIRELHHTRSAGNHRTSHSCWFPTLPSVDLSCK